MESVYKVERLRLLIISRYNYLYGLELDVCRRKTSSGNFYHHFEDNHICFT